MHRERCFCDLIPRLKLKTKLSLIIHSKELRRTTNTGVLAATALVNSTVTIRGLIGERLDLTSLLEANYRPILLYPAESAVELTPEFISQSLLPINLIVPDGNWRQASKVHYRHPELKHIRRVVIRRPATEEKRLRAETTDIGMATLQAVAHALGVIEGESVANDLLDLYKLKLKRTLQGRGEAGMD